MSAVERCSGLVAVLRRRVRADERGVVAVLVVLSLSGFMFATAAIGVDVAHWYLEAQRVQKVADVAALGAVTYLPQDMTSATSTALAIASRNGFPNSGTSTVTTAPGSRPSQLRVTVCSQVSNTFGGIIGTPSTTVCRTAVSDYTGPAPMGSPCNTFGNEPNSGGGTKAATPTGSALAAAGTRFANCSSSPQFWATIEGPQVDKVQGDRYSTTSCSSSVDGCTGTNNDEYNPAGYFWLVRVQPAAVGHTIDLQLFDPGFVYTGQDCGDLPAAQDLTDKANNYVTDGKTRYSPNSANTKSGGAFTCTGDSFTDTYGYRSPMITSFALRQQTDTLDPNKAVVQNDVNSAACIRQYKGIAPTRDYGWYGTYPRALTPDDLTSTSGSYNDELAKEFHNWTSFCKFTPTRTGDYYLQVRSNVSESGTALGSDGVAYKGNTNVLNADGNTTAGYGTNSFGIRAVTQPGDQNLVSVSGYDRMPIYANADSASSTMNLIRVLPGGAGKSISFSFFDVGDASGNGTVKVIPPADATNGKNGPPLNPQFPNGCKAAGGNAGAGPTLLSNCTAPFTGGANGSNNGHTETMSIPIPDDYTCNFNSGGGCWYQVQVRFSSGSKVHDVTTWTASITGDPVRLIE